MKQARVLLPAFFAATLLVACGAGVPSAAPYSTAITDASHTMPSSGASYKLLYAFKGTPDGASPFAGLIDVNGTLYGTTLNGSRNYCAQSCESNECYLGCGTVFAIDQSGSERVIYNFKGHFDGATDGSWPAVGLTLLHHRTLYGTTTGAGAYNDGTIFTVSTSGNERIKYSFSGADGDAPEGPMIAERGTLYGTTVYGGGSACTGYGCGAAFAFSSDGKERVLHVFSGGTDGERVYAPLTYLRGRFYGATLQGGASGRQRCRARPRYLRSPRR